MLGLVALLLIVSISMRSIEKKFFVYLVDVRFVTFLLRFNLVYFLFQTMTKPENISLFDFNPNNITNFTINGNDFVSLNEFSSEAQLRMIFDLNVLRRTQNNTWDSTNAREIMAFANKNKFVLDWQLGNGNF